jgi:hypothetical protein
MDMSYAHYEMIRNRDLQLYPRAYSTEQWGDPDNPWRARSMACGCDGSEMNVPRSASMAVPESRTQNVGMFAVLALTGAVAWYLFSEKSERRYRRH